MTTTQHQLSIEIPPSIRDRFPLDGYFGATTEVVIDCTARWTKHRPEPENGIPHHYFELERIELDAVDITIRLHGYEFTVPCKITDLPPEIRKDLIDTCHENVVDSEDPYFASEDNYRD